jgi:hypothetical protein
LVPPTAGKTCNYKCTATSDPSDSETEYVFDREINVTRKAKHRDGDEPGKCSCLEEFDTQQNWQPDENGDMQPEFPSTSSEGDEVELY